jgi:hypothetical protein
LQTNATQQSDGHATTADHLPETADIGGVLLRDYYLTRTDTHAAARRHSKHDDEVAHYLHKLEQTLIIQQRQPLPLLLPLLLVTDRNALTLDYYPSSTI